MRRRVRIRRLVAAMAGTAAVAAALMPVAAGAAPDPQHDSLYYCQEGADGGLVGASTTDYEHTVIVGDPPLPASVRASRVTVDGISTRVLQAGLPTAQEAVVVGHGHPGSSRAFDQLV